MKRLLSAVMACLLVALCISGVSASTQNTNVIDLGDGFYAEETLIINTYLRSTVKSTSKVWNIKNGSDVIATIEVSGTFSYDGDTVSVRSKEVVRCDTYDNWSFSQTGFTSSGGTITLSGKLSKGLSSKNISMSLSCDKNGNLS